jgi:superfamily II DNA or RNA helicase
MSQDWPHQAKAVADTLTAIEAGQRRVVLTSPTGGGKTRVAQRLIERWLADGLRTAVYTNRRMLIDQLSRVFAEAGLAHGIRAAGHKVNLGHALQICSAQTENARKAKWDRFPAQRVIVDEAHLQTGPAVRELLAAHHADGAAVVGLTATPLSLGGMYDHLIVAGTNSQLLDCGALVPVMHYGPDEPDLRALKKLREGRDLTEKQQRQAMKPPTLLGRVLDWYRRLNPDQRPTILFAPGVRESLWFAEQFSKAGIPAAHIDGEEVWFRGSFYETNEAVRREVLEESRCGGIKVLCNRFVLREGIDAPWLSHGIFACVFGSLQSYLQSGGRLLRAHPGLQAVTIQDHGGNWHRHGSLNADREWHLDYTPEIVTGLRADRFRQRQELEPCRCPNCARILVCGHCSGCGLEVKRHLRPRPVVMADGTLKELRGDIYKPRRVTRRPDAVEAWEKMYWRARSEKWNATFNQAATMFAQENNWGWPPRNLPLMPTDPLDWYRRVKDVPRDRLIPKPPAVPAPPAGAPAYPLLSC